MSRIKIALSEKNLAPGDRIKNFGTRLVASATVKEVSEKFVSATLDNEDTITFDARNGGTLSELMKAWDKSTNTELAKVGDRGYAVQQHTGMPFTYTVIEVIPGSELVIKYDDPSRSPETKNSVSVSVDQKMERYVSGSPALDELTNFAPRNVEGLEEKIRVLMTYLKGETSLFATSDEAWNARLFENSVIALVTNVAWSEGAEFAGGVHLNGSTFAVKYKDAGNGVNIVSAEMLSGSQELNASEIAELNSKLSDYFV